MKNSPIVLTVYNRPYHTREVLDALSKNELAKSSDLYIYSDGARNKNDQEKVNEVRKIINRVQGFALVKVIEARQNKGLANSVISAVNDVSKKYGKAIVLEDDLLTQKYFLNVMNQMLHFYEKDRNVASVSAFRQSHRLVSTKEDQRNDVFFNVRPTSYGWGTWYERWKEVDWRMRDYAYFINDKGEQKVFNKGGKDLTIMLDKQMKGEIDSWAIRWAYHCFKNKLISVNTSLSYVDDIGHDNSGVHSRNDSYFFKQTHLAEKKNLNLIPFSGEVDYAFIQRYYKHTSLSWPYIKRKLYSKLGILITK